MSQFIDPEKARNNPAELRRQVAVVAGNLDETQDWMHPMASDPLVLKDLKKLFAARGEQFPDELKRRNT